MWKSTLIVACIFSIAGIGIENKVRAQEVWEEPQNTAEALIEPDKYAWRLFVALNWPAVVAQKTADANRTFGDSIGGPVVWETWRNARNSAPDTVFKPDGSDPGPWLNAPSALTNVVARFDGGALQQQIRRKQMEDQNIPLPQFDQVAAESTRNETRLNKSTYEFVRSKSLYNLEGQVALFTNNQRAISFPINAKEIKAQWREIEDTQQAKSRYHWVAGDDGKTYGMTALHITTKDIPNWFWATFEHIDNKKSQQQGGHAGNEGWLLPTRDQFACGERNLPTDCEKAPPVFEGVQIDGTKWENYVLRGTQTDFVTSTGQTTLLANSHPERSFQLTSSCITCHARSSVGKGGERLPIFKCFDANGFRGDVGSPNPSWFTNGDGSLKSTQLDFVFSLMRAQPLSIPAPSSSEIPC